MLDGYTGRDIFLGIGRFDWNLLPENHKMPNVEEQLDKLIEIDYTRT